jgi:hypothetical protein
MEDRERPIAYRFVAGWERTNRRFADRQAFEELLSTEAVKWSNPVKTKWK